MGNRAHTWVTDDVQAEFPTGAWANLEDLATYMEEWHAKLGLTVHHISNIVITVTATRPPPGPTATPTSRPAASTPRRSSTSMGSTTTPSYAPRTAGRSPALEALGNVFLGTPTLLTQGTVGADDSLDAAGQEIARPVPVA